MASFAEHESAPQVELDRAVLLRLLSRYVRPFAGWIAGALLLGLLVSGALYLRAYLIKPILDDVIIPASRSEVGASHWLSDLPFVDSPAGGGSVEVSDLEGAVRGSVRSILLLSLLVVFAMPAAQFARAYLVEYVLGRVYIAIQQDVCSTLLALPLRFHHERRRGDVLSRTLEDVRSAHAAVALLFDDFAEALLMTAVGVTVLFAISWQLAAVFVILGPTLFGVIALFTRRISTSAQRRQEKFGDVTQRLVEILDGIKVIKAFRAEGAEDAAFRRETGKLFRRSMKVVKNRVLARSLVEMLNNGIAIGTLLVGTALVLGGR